MSVINTNVKALAAQGSLSNVNKSLETSMERLSTGLRINTAADDAAGLAITNRMTSQIRGYAVAIRNSNDGISMTQTADGAMGQVTSMLQRMRELSVQAANGAMSDTDRGSIQQEVTQLKAQIDDVAKKTNHNNINLLDGSAGKIVLQTGVNAGDTMTIGFGSVKTKDIGLGSRAALASVGGLATVNAALTDGSLVLNGVAVGASLSGSDTVSSASKAASSIAKAAAINLVSDRSGVYAKVAATSVAGSNTGAGVAAAKGVVKINGLDTDAVYMTGNKEIDRTSVVAAINDISARTGVTAVNTHDDNQGISLVAKDGRNIELAAGTGDAATLALMGLAAAGTYVGSYELSTKDGSAINVSSSVATVQTSQALSGLTFGTYEANKAQLATSPRAGVSAAAPSSADAGVLNGTTLTINGVGIAAAVGADDDASFVATASTKAASAIAIAAAINKSTDLTGVTAKANENVLAGTGFTAGVITNVTLNGVSMTTTLGANSTREDVLSTLNAHSGETGVIASAYGDGVKLAAADGRNISIAFTGAGGAGALGLTGVSLAATTVSKTFYAGVTLSSDKAFTLNSGSEGDTANFKALGFAEGTFGGADSGVKIAEVNVSTMSGATTAIQAIDAAIQTVGENQAKAGAYQNRLDAVVSNLTESTQNMSASRSRILDTDYATETTAMARSQIVAQAATAMLAQANQSAQSVLSLLK
ncbi:flagellin [Limnohabitans sp.]|uniref:flagellin N-terminal helical domain-containing protein n=1 Tax=Limnohabitans sp. TaxID=1907725 RepID=UPI00286F5B40|nr:flagellin [Limnohabitans sp.]